MRVIIRNNEASAAPLTASRGPDARDSREGYDASQHPAFRALIDHLNEPESAFLLLGSGSWSMRENGAPESATFGSAIDVAINGVPPDLSRKEHSELAVRVGKLLERDASESASAELLVFPAGDGNRGTCLRISIFASGADLAKARVRWSLAIVRLQQALMFESRGLSQRWR